jgi:hypothetical protein
MEYFQFILLENLPFYHKNMKQIFNPDAADLIRESFLVVFGLVLRFLELRKRKKNGSL